jgi:GNAT superfamily N-acetyltransferase
VATIRTTRSLHNALMATYRVRHAVVTDAQTIARHRVGMFRDMGQLTPEEAPGVEAATHAMLIDQIVSGDYVGWLAETAEDEVIAGAGVLLHSYYPTGRNPRGRPTAYILNVYTEPAHRRHGLASRLVSEILGWCRSHGIPRASLHSSAFGRSVYERLGFEPTNEMRLDIDSALMPDNDVPAP